MLRIKDRPLPLPILQGGMGIGVSLGNLAGHVAKCGGMGVVSAANPGFDEPDFWRDAARANCAALAREIRRAKAIAGGNGLIGVNVMVATTHYPETVRAAVEAGADAVISGAGLPADLPELVKGSRTAAAPIVSGARAARAVCRLWDRHHGVCPDFIVVEGREAGGHLGFKREELENGTTQTLEEILPEVRREITPFEEKYGRRIPVFAAGGVYTGADIARLSALGAQGAQIATRFIATYECDACERYKEIMISAKKEDVLLIRSPVGLPGRALRSPLTERVGRGGRIPVKLCAGCLHPCDPAGTPYCITRALIEAVKGNWEEGLFFCGSNVWRMDRMMHVSELLHELETEWRNAE